MNSLPRFAFVLKNNPGEETLRQPLKHLESMDARDSEWVTLNQQKSIVKMNNTTASLCKALMGTAAEHVPATAAAGSFK